MTAPRPTQAKRVGVPPHVVKAAKLKIEIRTKLGLPVKPSTVKIANLLPDNR